MRGCVLYSRNGGVHAAFGGKATDAYSYYTILGFCYDLVQALASAAGAHGRDDVQVCVALR
jgi:hypothetical protein